MKVGRDVPIAPIIRRHMLTIHKPEPEQLKGDKNLRFLSLRLLRFVAGLVRRRARSVSPYLRVLVSLRWITSGINSFAMT